MEFFLLLTANLRDESFFNYYSSLKQVEFVKNRFDAGASEVVNVILTLNTQISGDMSQCTSSVTYDQV